MIRADERGRWEGLPRTGRQSYMGLGAGWAARERSAGLLALIGLYRRFISPLLPAPLPLRAHLLGVRARGDPGPWRGPRDVARGPAYRPVPSLVAPAASTPCPPPRSGK